jgi:hypothetical protein
MDGLAIILVLGALGAAAAMLTWSRGRSQQSDLGVVSQRWLAEHRSSHAHQPPR